MGGERLQRPEDVNSGDGAHALEAMVFLILMVTSFDCGSRTRFQTTFRDSYSSGGAECEKESSLMPRDFNKLNSVPASVV